jgi:oligopeptide/dipeptide ABC transporter ATP-binding protein
MAALLEVDDLRVTFPSPGGPIPVVEGVSFRVEEGEPVALVGESGSGKTLSALSILNLVTPPGRIAGGVVRFRGRDVLSLSDPELRAFRGKDAAMVFQEPLSALNPVMTIGAQIAEAVLAHERVSKREALGRSEELLARVRMADPRRCLTQYPHQLSGGMRQRAMIAMALACRPALLIADEPTTALDVTVQAQVLDLLAELRESTGMALLLITHDLGVVARTVDRVYVMYAGRVVETATVERLFEAPAHPYTRGLLDSLPRLNRREKRLRAIPGTVAPPGSFGTACAFAPRCPRAKEDCRRSLPPWVEVVPGQGARCLYPEVGPIPAEKAAP